MLKLIKKLTFTRTLSLEEKRFFLSGGIICAAILAVLFNAVITKQGLIFCIILAAFLLLTLGIIIFVSKKKKLRWEII